MKNSTTAVIIVFLAIHLVFSFVALAGNDKVNMTKTESMTNTTLQNCSENCSEIQDGAVFKNCTQDCKTLPIRVTLETTGGFAGLTTTKSIDSDEIAAEQANRLRQFVEASDFFNLPATIAYRGPARDFFQYNLTVESEGKKHTIEVDEPAAPSELKPLLQWLRTI